MDFQFKPLITEKDHVGVVFCDSKNRLLGYAKKLDQISKKSISTVISNDASFQKRKSKTFDYAIIHAPTNLKLSKVYVFRLSDYSKFSVRDFQILGGNLYSLISFYQEDKVGIYFDGIVSKNISALNSSSEMMLGSLLASYKFDKYKTINKKEKTPLLLILDQLSDVRNFGAIIRTAECTGVDAIIIQKNGSAPVNAETIKTSAGAAFKIPICKVDHIKDALFLLQAYDIKTVAATEKTETSVFDYNYNQPIAIIMGSEGKGINPSVLKMVDYKAKLPLLGEIESLNVSVACGVFLYEAIRQRQ